MIYPPTCHACAGRRSVKLRRIEAANSVSMVAWRCLACNVWAKRPHHWLSKKALDRIVSDVNRRPDYSGFHVGQIPLLADYKLQCQVCQAAGAEWHHWFPTAIRAALLADEAAARWSTFQVLLCRRCHRLWHESVTWYLPGYTASEHAMKARNLYKT